MDGLIGEVLVEGGWLSGSCGADPDDEQDRRPVSWAPTFGPETAADVARPVDASVKRRGLLHPPGGPW